MSAPPSQSSSQPAATTFNERLNEQLINCLNVQTSVIQNLAQYSQHISLQLFEIKNIVEILSNRVSALQQQQQQQAHYGPPPPPVGAHFPASYYPNYPPPPTIPTSHPSSFMSHPPPPPPPMPFGIPQQFSEPRGSVPMSNMPHGNHPSFPHSVPNHPPPPVTSSSTSTSSSSNPAPFQFATTSTNIPATSSTKPITTTAAPGPPVTTTVTNTTGSTASSQSLFANLLKSNPTESNATKPPAFFPQPSSNQNGTTGFNFGTTSTASPFGTGFGFTPSSNSSAPVVKSETHADEDDEAGGEDDSYEPNDSFKPIVQLAAVETKTGEEEENALFCERAKLYRFDGASNQMKERGIGEMKILQHKTTQHCRILMRREQVLKLCANHQITPQMELKPHAGSSNAFLWSAMDFADGEAKHETLCVRFKTEEQAKKFFKIFNEAKENYGKSTNGPTTTTATTTTSANDDDVIPIGEVKPSAEQIDRAKKLQLPSTFFLYENKEPCTGCAGCEKDSPSGSTSENHPAPKTQTETKAAGPQTPTTKTPLSSSENTKFSFGITEKLQPTLQKQTSSSNDDNKSTSGSSSTPDTAPPTQYDNKPSIFGGFGTNSSQSIFGGAAPTNGGAGSISSLFGGNPLKPATNGTGGFSFPGFGGGSTSTAAGTTTTTANSAPFSFGTPTTTNANTSGTTSTSSPFSFGTQGAKPLFGGTGGFSFADLAKQTTSTNEKSTPNGNDQRVFAGQGSLVFGTPGLNKSVTKTNQDDDDGEGGGEDDSYEPEVSFKPIVQLAAVETKTGEEEENVLFCERAKLYRFDGASNQMKERGIGEMKILQHKTTQQYRILMRREQVLKLCANHQITSQMEMKQHGGAENAYVWSATDFADGEAKHETLCIRFKTAEQAKKFLKIFNEAKQSHAETHQ